MRNMTTREREEAETGPPRAAPAYFPYPHKNQAQIMAEEREAQLRASAGAIVGWRKGR
jgi:hypothetical protein